MPGPLVFAICGMLTLAAALWLMYSGKTGSAAWKLMAFVLILSGTAGIVWGALQASRAWSLRISVICLYAASAGIFAGPGQSRAAVRKGGAVLADLGTGITGGMKVTVAVAVTFGITGIVMQALDTHRPATTLLLSGQTLFFTAMGVRTVLLARSRWRLGECGIVGPEAFIPWNDVCSYEWNGDDQVVITRTGGFANARRLTIRVLPEKHDETAAVFAAKLGSEPRA